MSGSAVIDSQELATPERLRELSLQQCWQFYMDAAAGLMQLGDVEGAMRVVGRAADVAESLSEQDARLARTLNALAVLHCYLDEYAAGEAMFRRAVGLYEKLEALEHDELPTVLCNLGHACGLQDKHSLALVEYERALARLESAPGHSHADAAIILDSLGATYTALNRPADALACLKRALSIKEATLGAATWETAITLAKIGEVYLREGRYTEAEPVLSRALRIKQAVLGNDPVLVGDLKRLAYSYAAQRKFHDADPLLTSAFAMARNILRSRHPQMVRSLEDLAKTYRKQARGPETTQLLSLTIGILEKMRGADHADVETSLQFYAEILRALTLEARA